MVLYINSMRSCCHKNSSLRRLDKPVINERELVNENVSCRTSFAKKEDQLTGGDYDTFHFCGDNFIDQRDMRNAYNSSLWQCKPAYKCLSYVYLKENSKACTRHEERLFEWIRIICYIQHDERLRLLEWIRKNVYRNRRNIRAVTISYSGVRELSYAKNFRSV